MIVDFWPRFYWTCGKTAISELLVKILIRLPDSATTSSVPIVVEIPSDHSNSLGTFLFMSGQQQVYGPTVIVVLSNVDFLQKCLYFGNLTTL